MCGSRRLYVFGMRNSVFTFFTGGFLWLFWVLPTSDSTVPEDVEIEPSAGIC